ncbi:MAG TPA: hypothetical protein VM934_08505 [Pyrinomonadaceae bacterium]|jgi:hypothetical protein|nr:hypothetical protein [Pyrinomonadaceae bacterium]
MDATYTAPPLVDRWRQRALVVGLVVLVVSAVVALLYGPAQFFRAYLVGFFFCTGIAVGSLAWLMLQHLSGGGWGLVLRRILEAATRTLPLLFVLFVPIIISLFVHGHGHGGSLYEWSDPAVVAGDDALKQKVRYFLNAPFFIIRGVFYFVVWGALAYFLNKWSGEQDKTGDPRVRRKMQELSGPGLLLLGLTVTFAAIDWGMSLEPHWFSTIYGLIVLAGWGLSALSFAIVVASVLARHEPMTNVFAPSLFQDFGKLLLALVMLYAYFSFSQFLIIWSGNLPEEIPFYLRRVRSGWQYVGLALILFHFALPFILLLSRNFKRSGRLLSRVAVLMLAMRILDLIFLFAPAGYAENEQSHIQPIDFLTMSGAAVGLGGVWLWYYLGQLRQRPLLPVGAPDLEKALTVVEHH